MKKIGRTRKALINTSSLLLKEVIALICNFILPRLILGYFGSTYNGVITSITQFLNIASFLRLGIAGSTRSELYKSLSDNDSDGISSTVNASQSYMMKTGLIVLVYIISLIFIFPSFFSGGLSAIDVGILVIALGITSFSQYILSTTYVSLLTADQKAYIIHFFESAIYIVSTVVSCLLILGGINLPWVKLIASFIWLVLPLFIYFFCKKKYKINRKIKKNISFKGKKNAAMFHSLANIIHENVDIVALTLFCGPVIVSIYGIYRLVTNGIRQALTICTGSLEAPFGELKAKGKTDGIRENLILLEHLTSTFIALVFTVASVLIIPFISLYTSNIHDTSYVLPNYAMLLVLCEAIYALRIPYQTIVQAYGHYRETRQHALIEALLNVIITFSLTWVLGLIGTVIGTLVANCYRLAIYTIYTSNRLVKRPMSFVFERIAFVIISSFTIYVVCNKVDNYFYKQNWNSWIICGFIDVLLGLTIVVFLGLFFYKNESLLLGRKFCNGLNVLFKKRKIKNG